MSAKSQRRGVSHTPENIHVDKRVHSGVCDTPHVSLCTISVIRLSRRRNFLKKMAISFGGFRKSTTFALAIEKQMF